MSIKQKLFAVLDKIGNTNGHSCPESQDPAVPLLHEYFIATDGEAYFKKRREVAKKKLEKELSAPLKKKLDKHVADVKETEVADTCTLTETEHYVLSVDVKNGASYVDMADLKVMLMREHKMNATAVEALIEKCTKRREPSKGWRVVER